MQRRSRRADWVLMLTLAMPMAPVWAGQAVTSTGEATELSPERAAGGDRVLANAIMTPMLSEYVDADGYVDYSGMAEDHAKLDGYLEYLSHAELAEMNPDMRLATLINAYNAFTLKLILERYDGGELASIMDIPEGERWQAKRWELSDETVSLDQLEHEIIRKEFADEPRIHWALVCAAVSCPPLRTEAYVGERLDDQLADQERYVFSHPRYYQPNPAQQSVGLTQLLNWYGEDFVETGSVLQYVAPRVDANVENWSIQWIEYDWSLNAQPDRSE